MACCFAITMETIVPYNEKLFANFNCLENYSLNFRKSVTAIIEKNGFLKCTIDVNDIDTNNGNYLARLYAVDIKGRTEESKKEIHLFIKECLVLENIKIIDMNEIYDKEVFVYTNYANATNTLQKEAKIPEYDSFKFVPAYGGNSEILILDNLSKQGFKTYYRMDVMPIKYAELAMQELAKFHALGFAVEKKMPEYFEKHIKTKKSAYNFDEDWRAYLTKLCSNLAKTIEGSPASLEKYAPIMQEKIIKFFKQPGNCKQCLCHGDYRVNNILVKEVDRQPVEVSVVDYQMVDYGSPMRDFVYLLYTSSDRNFRQRHASDLKDIYHDTMTRFLVYFNLDVGDIYSREDFEKAYTDYLELGLIIGLYVAPFLFQAEGKKLDASKISLSEVDFANMDIRYTDRVQGLIEELVELGYL